jgi:hypothetical protein
MRAAIAADGFRRLPGYQRRMVVRWSGRQHAGSPLGSQSRDDPWRRALLSGRLRRGAPLPRSCAILVGGKVMRDLLSRAFLLVIAASMASASCSVSGDGLGSLGDAGAGGSAGAALCPSGLLDKGNWPATAMYTACSEHCGPDDLGFRACSQVSRPTCQASAGCLCIDSLCASCASCSLPTSSECYVPTNTAATVQIPTCDKTVKKGGACRPVCARQLCLQSDGKTGCVCNASGKYACATWGESSWK